MKAEKRDTVIYVIHRTDTSTSTSIYHCNNRFARFVNFQYTVYTVYTVYTEQRVSDVYIIYYIKYVMDFWCVRYSTVYTSTGTGTQFLCTIYTILVYE